MRTNKDSSQPFAGRLTRRDALKAIGTAAAAGVGGACFPSLFHAALGARRPNIIFILTDDHRWDHLGFLGHPFLRTPNLDRLAGEGVNFANAFVVTSLCSPSRATFLTGMYAHQHGVKNNLTHWRDSNVTVLELLKNAGYDTAFIGKWHMPGGLPEVRGVDLFVSFTAEGGQGRYFNCPLFVNGEEAPSRKAYITEELTDRAIEFIQERKDRPFCVFLFHKAAHHQFLPPPDMAGMYDRVPLDLPKEADLWIGSTNGMMFEGTLGPITWLYRNYCETLTATDREVGRVLDTLDRTGLADDTVVVYAGDNGFFWGEHRLVDKRWAYEESIRIPFIVRYPRLIGEAGTREQMIINPDLAPSLLELAGLPVPAAMEGRSFAPLLESGSVSGRDAWLYEYFRDYPYPVPQHVAVRTRTHKYIEYEGRRRPELYDLVNDPKEKTNLIGTDNGARLLKRLKPLLQELRK